MLRALYTRATLEDFSYHPKAMQQAQRHTIQTVRANSELEKLGGNITNNYVAHGEKELRDGKLASQNLKSWVVALSAVASPQKG